jgi:endonuclease/exonuclease/phosphatase family metal-dependent hydrolase
LLLLLLNPYSLLRTGMLIVIEVALALLDVTRGLIEGRNLWKELKFIPSRVGICVLLRELVTIGAKMDAARGLPVIHANFLGYDEQAHRRGPSSRFAHWALRGIDDAIKRIAGAARRSARRDYDLWVYSDHGQEETRPFPQEQGRSIQEAVSAVFADRRLGTTATPDTGGIQTHRIRMLRRRRRDNDQPDPEKAMGGQAPDRPIIAAMGPVAHVYPRGELTAEERGRLAHRLVHEAGVPMVLHREPEGRCHAASKAGDFLLPDDAQAVFGPDHPFVDEVARDLVDLCRHADAGPFVLCGWSRDREPVSFAVENGSHAGPGPEETGAFALLPKDTPLEDSQKGFVRPLDLRSSALEVLDRDSRIPRYRALRWKASPQRLRVLTYNVHSCIGLDGRLSPRRIARVIAWHDPDVVALQELDVGRARTEGHDQARFIAELLWMEHHFYPALRLEEERYGDAIMSRWPLKLIQADGLPRLRQPAHLEPRGALWGTIKLEGRRIHLLNTHFGLRRQERIAQVRALLSPDWLGGLGADEPVVLCGDFNSLPGSPVYKSLAKRLQDVQTSRNGHRPLNTWFGRYPLGRIDHIFTSRHFGTTRIEVGDFDLARVSSDHRPLLAELHFRRHS